MIEDERWAGTGLERIATRVCGFAMDHLQVASDGFEVVVLGTNDARISALNADFRGKPSATNVLSWPAFVLSAPEDGTHPIAPPEPDPRMPTSLGDIALAYETCTKEATQAKKPLEHHISHLCVHGLLHLLGYDHIRDRDATLMEAIETEILGKLGIPDPYYID